MFSSTVGVKLFILPQPLVFIEPFGKGC